MTSRFAVIGVWKGLPNPPFLFIETPFKGIETAFLQKEIVILYAETKKCSTYRNAKIFLQYIVDNNGSKSPFI